MPLGWLCWEWQFELRRGAGSPSQLLKGRRGRTRHAWRGFIRGDTSCLLQTSDSSRTAVVNPTPAGLHVFTNPHMNELPKSGHWTHPRFVHWDLWRLAWEAAESPVCCAKCKEKCSQFFMKYQSISKGCLCVRSPFLCQPCLPPSLLLIPAPAQ